MLLYQCYGIKSLVSVSKFSCDVRQKSFQHWSLIHDYDERNSQLVSSFVNLIEINRLIRHPNLQKGPGSLVHDIVQNNFRNLRATFNQILHWCRFQFQSEKAFYTRGPCNKVSWQHTLLTKVRNYYHITCVTMPDSIQGIFRVDLSSVHFQSL